jgi:uncharacterized protein with beta-barrel porin domain
MARRGRWLGLLLASCSTAALLIGGGAPAAFAACANGAGSGTGFDNPAAHTTPCVAVTNTSFAGNITNEGTIAPGGVTFTNGTMSGFLSSSGNILGGISLDKTSTISNAVGTTVAITSTTFLGGISSAGVIAADGRAIVVSGSTTFGNGITNAATGSIIANHSSAISIAGVSRFSGGISNAGTISAGGHGIDICSCVSTFTGGIANSGTISAGGTGILVNGVQSFGGGVSNGGLISASFVGIGIGGVTMFTEGIGNSGTITAGSVGIAVAFVESFSGGIFNAGTISTTASDSPGIGVLFVGSFSQGISNAGMISVAGFTSPGIEVALVESFGGGIANSGTVSAGPAAPGILVTNVGTFTEGIRNQGFIEGNVGILVGGTGCGCSSFVGTFKGGIVNDGTIVADGFLGPGAGILVENVGKFADGISNAGLISASGALHVGGAGIVVSAVSAFSGGIDNSGTIVAAPGNTGFPGFFPVGGTGIVVSDVGKFTGDITNRGRITAGATGTGFGIVVAGVGYFNGNIVNTGTIVAGQVGIQVVGVDTFGGGISNGGLISVSGAFSSVGISIQAVGQFNGGLRNSGTIMGAGVGIDICDCVGTFSNGLTNTGLISAAFAGIVINAQTFFGDLTNSGTIKVSSVSGTGIFVTASFAGGHIVNTGTISAANAINMQDAATAMIVDQKGGLLAGDILFSPHGDTLNVGGGTINGNIVGVGGSGDTINFDLNGATFTYAAAYGFSGIDQVNVKSGIVILDGSNSAGSATITGGVLQVGDSANPGATLTLASGLDVIGGALSGHGTVAGDVAIESGGILAPGGSIGTLSITGALTFNGGTYAIQIAPGAGNNSATAVGGSATINGGTVLVIPQLGHYNATTYTIMTTGGGVSGTFSPQPVFAGPFAFTGTSSVSNDSTNSDVLLNLGAGYAILSTSGANVNQQNVLNGINNAILSNQTLPPQFQNLANLSGSGLLNALTQSDGEAGAGFLQGAFQAGNSFLNLLVNAFLDGRFDNGGGFGAAMGFAAEDQPALPQAALAFASAMPVKAPIAPAGPAPYRFWGSAYGGAESVDGNSVIGSHNTTSHVFSFAAGVDYRVAPATTLGFALAGGGTSWGLDAGLGGGRSDMFQAGAYASHRWDAAYLSAALAYNFHDVTTDRTDTVAGVDHLTASFQAHGIGARIEGGWRYATPWLGVTPYAAAQVQSIFLPAYGESATSGSSQFALNYAAQTATATRGELGVWLDKSRLLDNGALLTLYGRAAWAHDHGDTPAASAIFQALPGSNFVVNGAAPAPDSALVTAGAQYRMLNGWSFLAKFDGEFSSTTSVYAGTGMVKKTW